MPHAQGSRASVPPRRYIEAARSGAFSPGDWVLLKADNSLSIFKSVDEAWKARADLPLEDKYKASVIEYSNPRALVVLLTSITHRFPVL